MINGNLILYFYSQTPLLDIDSKRTWCLQGDSVLTWSLEEEAPLTWTLEFCG